MATALDRLGGASGAEAVAARRPRTGNRRRRRRTPQGRTAAGSPSIADGAPRRPARSRLRARGRSPTETVCLRNCPYDALAADHRDLTCGMNLAWAEGVVDGLGLGRPASSSPRSLAVAASSSTRNLCRTAPSSRRGPTDGCVTRAAGALIRSPAAEAVTAPRGCRQRHRKLRSASKAPPPAQRVDRRPGRGPQERRSGAVAAAVKSHAWCNRASSSRLIVQLAMRSAGLTSFGR